MSSEKGNGDGDGDQCMQCIESKKVILNLTEVDKANPPLIDESWKGENLSKQEGTTEGGRGGERQNK